MFHTITDFLNLWREETAKTEKLLLAIPDSALKSGTKTNTRTIKQLVWHILESPKEMLERTGLKIVGLEDHETTFASIKNVVQSQNKVAESVAHQIQTHWNNKSLHQTDDMYGQMWTRDKTLTCMLLHMIHHRGQLTILMRQAGIAVPGMYGPGKEEWAQYGMEEPQEPNF